MNYKRINSERSTPTYILIKLSTAKGEDRTLMTGKEERLIIYKGPSVRVTSDV